MRRTLAVVGMIALFTGSMSFGFAADPDPTVKHFLTTCAETCPFRKLNPSVLMVKSAQNVGCNDGSAPLDEPAIG